MTLDPLVGLDVATGMMLPRRDEPTGRMLRTPRGRSRRERAETPRHALERAILPALLRPPCLVSFSGGRDSAAVLAAATGLARREGLPAPIPATNLIPSAPEADETSWQELLVRHLGLDDWLRIEHTDELDLIGPYARRVLRTHGLLWPANVHFHLPLLDAARGGSLLTGVGGDELYSAARATRVAAVLSATVRPRPRDLLSFGLAFAPRAIRRTVLSRRATSGLPWLRPRAARLVRWLLADESAAEPRSLERRMPWWRARRYLRVAVTSLDLVANEADALLVHPLLAEEFWNAVAVAAQAGSPGFEGRTDGVRRLFGDLLPPEIVGRSSKANFNEVFWAGDSHTFVRSWDGSGVPDEWVDAESLAQHWATGAPAAQSGTLLQAAWLASAGDRREQACGNLVA